MNTQLTDQQIFDIAQKTLLYANITPHSKDLSVDGDEMLCFARALLAAATPERTITQIAGVYDSKFECIVILALSNDQMIYSSIEGGSEWIKRAGPLPQD